MRIGWLLLLVFLIVPIVEIWLLIAVGGVIGAVPTIGLVVLTAVLGMALIRRQGTEALRRAQADIDSGRTPLAPAIDGVFLLLAGAMLLTPGFFTDTIGFLCLVPAARRAVAGLAWRHFGERIVVRAATMGAPPRPGGPGAGAPRRPGPVIEGDFTEVSPGEERRNGNGAGSRNGDPESPWRGQRLH